MHAAPSVNYPVGRSAFAAWLHGLAGLAGLAAALAWTAQSAAFGWRQALALALVAGCTGLAFAAWQRSPAGTLRWDGASWSWEEGEEGGAAGPGHPEIALDLQNRLVLRWRGEGARARWLWLERAADPLHWEALRRAVYSRASAPLPSLAVTGQETPPAGPPPTAKQ